MKLAIIICNIQSHSSKQRCCWCDIKSTKLINCGSLRIFGGKKNKHKEFINANENLKKTKGLQNAVHLPLLKFPDQKLVLEAILPMELHLLLGSVLAEMASLFLSASN